MKKFLCAVLTVIFALGLCACGKSAGGEKQKNEAVTPVGEEITPAVHSAEQESHGTEIVIEDLVSYSGTYTDSVGNEDSYSYVLPMITGVESETVSQFNNEMQQLEEQYIEPELANMEDGLSLLTFRSVYHWACRDGITSILVALYNNWGLTEYHCCNFNESGDAVTNEQLLARLSVSSDALLAQMDEIYGAHASPDVPMFITQSGCLGTVLTCDSLAGADHYAHLMIYRPDSGFTPEQLCELALDRYESVNGSRPGNAEAEKQSDGTVAIQLYDDMDDHTATADWYFIDPLTGTGTDILGNEVDLTFC